MDFERLKTPRPAPYADTELVHVQQHYAGLLDSDAGRRVLAILGEDARVRSLTGKMIASGLSSSRTFGVQWVAQWLLWAVNEYGQEAAIDHLERYLDDPTVTVVTGLWVLGVELDDEIELPGGYRIVPLDRMPDSWQKSSYSRDPNGPRAAICCALQVEKVRGASGMTTSDPRAQRVHANMTLMALLLNAIDDIACEPYSWNSYLPPNNPHGVLWPLDRGELLGR